MDTAVTAPPSPYPGWSATHGDRSPTRPLLRWHGGKWRLAPWVIQHLPPHRIYAEPYGGAASVLLRKPRARAEVWNDLDGTLVNLFRVLRSDRAGELVRSLALTPFAREEFEDAYEVADDPVEEARRLVVRSFMGHGSDSSNRTVRSGFRKSTTRHGTIPAEDWASYPAALNTIVERLRGVVVERVPALDLLIRYDHPEALFYLDPPYVGETRSSKARKGGVRYHAYIHEMTAEDHAEMLRLVQGVQGMVVLSGYPTPLYDTALRGWRRVERIAYADNAEQRREVLWISPRAVERSAGVLPFGNTVA